MVYGWSRILHSLGQAWEDSAAMRGDFHFGAIQKLRAVAALSVVFVHLFTQWQRLGYAGHWPASLTAGVDLFFVISGFIMWITTAGTGITPGAFVRKRLIRIVPLYWLLTSFVVAIALIAPNLMQSTMISPGYVAKSFLFIPAEHPVLRGEFMPVLTPGWTLELELPFYGLMALALFLPVRMRLLVLLTTLVAVACMHVLAPADTAFAFLTKDLVVEFGYGLLIGACLTFIARWPAWTGPVLILAGFAAAVVFYDLAPLEWPHALMPGLPMAIVVLGAVVCDTSALRLPDLCLTRLGDASYSLYLTHGLFLSALLQLWRRILPQPALWNWLAFSGVATIACALMSLVVYRFVELPLNGWVSRKVDDRLRQSQVAQLRVS